MKLETRVAYNTLIQFAGKIVSTGLSLISIALIARYLGQIGFGEFTTATTYLSFFAIIADLGLTLVTVQMISQPGANQEKILGNLLALRLVSAVIFLGLAPLLVQFFPYSQIIKLAVLVNALSFVCIALNQVLVGLFQKNLRLDKVVIAEVASRVVLVMGTIFVIQQDLGLIGFMAAIVVSSLVSFFFHFIFSRQFARIKLQFDFAYWRQIIRLSWPLAVTIMLNLVYLKTDILLLSVLPRPSDLGLIAEVGLYGAAYRVVDVVVTFPFIFAGIILPLLSSRWANRQIDDFKITLQKSFDVMALLAIPLVIGTQLLAREIMVLVAGNEFAASGPILQILIGAAALIYLGVMFSHAIIAINKQRQIIGAYIFTAVTAVAGYLVFIPRFSYFGAAWTTIYSELAITMAAAYLIWKYLKFIPSFAVSLKALAASGVMAVAIYGLNSLGHFNLFVILTVSIIVYFITLYAIKGINRQDLLTLLNK